MATLTLDRNNYVLLGLNNGDRYNEFFGQIVDYREDENNRGTYWLKIQVSYEVREMREHDELLSMSSQDLGNIPRLESFSQEEGERISQGFKDTIERRAQELRERGTEASPSVPEQEFDETVGDVEEIGQLISERHPMVGGVRRPTREREATVQTPPPAPEAILQVVGEDAPLIIDTKEFSMNMESGDMKTVLKIAEKSPSKVFNILDKAIQENGHIVLNYMTQGLRRKMIDLKIGLSKDNEEILLENGKTYKLTNGAEEVSGIYLGKGYWIFPRSLSRVSEITEALVRLPENFLEKFSCKKIDDQAVIDDIQNLTRSTLDTLPNHIRYELDEGISTDTLDYIQTFKRQVEINTLTSEILGESWTKTITYYYFMGGEFKWDDIALNTFNDKESILKLATIRQDNHVLGILEAA